MQYKNIKTLAGLREINYKELSVKQEVRKNLIQFLNDKKSFAPDIIGYEDTVFPQIQNAILSQHDFILLGLRGQGKSRILKSLSNLLDDYIPIVKGSLLNESPFNPILKSTINKICKDGEKLEIEWLHKSERFSEKLATPDVSMADLIGDIDPIKAANLGLNLSDPDVIDFGLIPKSNRGIFAINELADLQSRIQVGLFNIMEEKAIQIKGFPIQFNLDMMLVYTANPEDYTARGSIITPLKDRIDSQIITHYPLKRDTGIQIIKQEVNSNYKEMFLSKIPGIVFSLVEEIAIQARKSDFIDQKSGVSARLSISAMENIIAAAERRSILNDENFSIRLGDLYAAVPAITGKIELLYEGEQEGSSNIADGLIGLAIQSVFKEYIKNQDESNLFEPIKEWFSDNKLYIDDIMTNDIYQKSFSKIPNLSKLAEMHFPNYKQKSIIAFLMQFILESMVMNNHLSKFKLKYGIEYSDMMESLFGGDNLSEI
jgi:magnesium chelatase subunit I